MYCQHSPVIQMMKVKKKGFLCQQMNGNGVTGKCIDCKHIEVLLRLAFEGKTGIAQRHLDLRLRVSQEGELSVGYLDDQWVDLVKPVVIARPAIAGEGSRSQSDRPHPLIRMALARTDGETDSGVRPVVSGGPCALLGVEKLLAVHDRSIRERPQGALRL